MSQAVERALDVLELCADRAYTLAELTEELDVHRTTVLRLVQLLSERGMLARGDDGRYRIGFRLGALSHSAIEHFDLRRVAQPHLKALADDLGYSVHLAAPLFGRIISVAVIEPPYGIRLPQRVGGTVLTHVAGVSKAILAFLPDSEADALLSGVTWERFTDRTITSREEMEQVLAQVRERGWAFDDGGFEDISNSIAAPIRDHTDHVAGAVSITAFKPQTPVSKLADHLPRLLQATEDISRTLGWRGHGPVGSQRPAGVNRS